MKKPTIVFMGTPDFAVASLDAILKAGYVVNGVVTSPDKPSGRGLQLHASPVKAFALEHQLPVLQPEKLRNPVFLEQLRDLKADLQVVVAFRMLPEEVWSMPPLGTFNLHASLLPQYRGAAPINWAIINGERTTGLTTFLLNHEIDKGAILFSETMEIGENENAGELHDRMMVTGAGLVVKTIDALANGHAIPVEQNHTASDLPLKTAPKIFKNDCRISWDKPGMLVHNFIRGLSPYPAAWCEIITGKGERLSVKIFKGKFSEKSHHLLPGMVETDNRSYLSVALQGGFYTIESLQLQAKKQMKTAEFLRGFPGITQCRFV